jgi:hypothetical protein
MTRSWRLLVGAAFIAIVVIVALTVVSRRPFGFAAALRSRSQTVRAELFSEIQPVHVTNCELLRFGEAHDGGYPLCRNLLRRVKAGYSYGISGYDGWGCNVSRRLHIRVHQYDCFELREPSWDSFLFETACSRTSISSTSNSITWTIRSTSRLFVG